MFYLFLSSVLDFIDVIAVEFYIATVIGILFL